MPVQTQWEHAHQCQVCGYIIRIDDIGAKVIAAGIVTCQKCDASGPVNVKIVDAQQISDSMQRVRAKRS
jgi:ribosomal protein L37AE/L43A